MEIIQPVSVVGSCELVNRLTQFEWERAEGHPVIDKQSFCQGHEVLEIFAYAVAVCSMSWLLYLTAEATVVCKRGWATLCRNVLYQASQT
jgi:hypothetical protein